MPNPVPPHSDDEFDAEEPESVEFLLRESLKDLDDSLVDNPVSTDVTKPRSKIADSTFNSGLVSGSESLSCGSPFFPGFIERDSTGDPGTDPDAEHSREEIPNIEGYVILRELGRGGMGVVYKAKQIDLKRIVALKMILRHGSLTKETLTRFRTEADSLARVAHPGIVQVYEISEHEGQAYFTLEYCGGGSLAREIKKGPFAPPKAATVVEQLARAIHFAHEANIIHRDLKPGNVLRTTLGQYKITDFGLAKKLDIEENITQSGAIIGTPGYMSPEQASGDVDRLGPACDIYALGVILYECVTGRVPFRAQSVMDAVVQVVTLEPVAPTQLEPKTPKDLETIILKCLHKTPERRYRTALDLADDLGRFLRGEPILGRPASRTERAWRWGRKHPAASAAMAMSAFALIAALGLIVWKNQELESEVATAIKREADAQSELQAKRRLDQQKGDIQAALNEARNAERDGRWDVMTAAANRAIAIGDSRTELAAEREEAKILQARAESEIRLTEQVVANRQLLTDLDRARDQVRTLSSPFTNLDLQTRNAALTEASAVGLKLVGLTPEIDPELSLPPGITPDQEREIREGCFELYLALADAASVKLEGEDAAAAVARARAGIVMLDRASRLLEGDASWSRRKAALLRQAGDQNAAARLEVEGQKREPKTAFDYFMLGENSYRLGDADAAKLALNESLRLDPGYFWAQYYLALTVLQAKGESPAEARTYMNFCIERKPEFDALYIVRGIANLRLSDYPHAEEDFTTALELAAVPLTRFGIHVNRATLRLQVQDRAGALSDLQAAREIKPTERRLYTLFAQIYWAEGDTKKALTELDEGVAQHPRGDSLLYSTRAYYRKKSGDQSGAIADLDQAIALEPRNGVRAVADRLDRARLLLDAKQFDRVIAECDETLGLGGVALLKANRIAALRLKAEALAETQQYSAALDVWEQASRLGWNPSTEEYRFRGLCQAKMGRLFEAVADLTQAIEKNPSASNLTERGWLYLRTNAWQRAFDDFDAALKLATTADALGGRALARTSRGDFREGVKDAEEALAQAGTSKRALLACARVYSRAAVRVAIPPQGKPPRIADLELRTRYQEKAADLLARTVESLPAADRAAFWTELRKDDSLQPLAKVPAFAKLDKQYSTGRANQP
jgi:eukaryotic-like serine/threonine-protein kinase